MTDLCANGGSDAITEYSKTSNPYTESARYDEASGKLEVLNKEVYCGNEGVKDFLALLNKIITECPDDHPYTVELQYYSLKLNMISVCSNDSVTGEECGKAGILPNYSKPYSEWDPKLCESSCVDEFDGVLRELHDNPACKIVNSLQFISKSEVKDPTYACTFYESGGNSVCGTKNFAGISKNGDAVSATINSTTAIPANVPTSTLTSGATSLVSDNTDLNSSATALTSHVALFSLIMCILFAFFK